MSSRRFPHGESYHMSVIYHHLSSTLMSCHAVSAFREEEMIDAVRQVYYRELRVVPD